MKRKKILFWLMIAMTICLSLLIGDFSVEAQDIDESLVASGMCGEEVAWTLNDNGIMKISGRGSMYDYNSYTDTPWYSNYNSIKSVIIDEGVTSVGKNAFRYNTRIENVTIAESVTKIGVLAFMDCDKLSSIVIPKNVSLIDEYAFCNCNSLSSIEILSDEVIIGKYAFNVCYGLKSVTIPKGVKKIDELAFGGSWYITTIRFEGDAPEFGENVFSAITADVYYPSNLESWTTDKLQNYDGRLTWIPYEGDENDNEQITEYKGSFSFLNGEGTGDATLSLVDYKDTYFYESSYEYNHQLAKMSLCMALASFNTYDGNYFAIEPEQLKIENKLKTKAGNAVELLLNCGFEEDSIILNKAYLKAPEENSIGVVLAKKEINGETLIAVVVRGGGYEKEWASNFKIYNTGGEAHPGFQSAANQVNQAFSQYIIDQNITGDIKVWVMGYSRGAATANLVAAHLNDMAEKYTVVSLEKKDIYAYTFETPQNTKSSSAKDSDYENIFNIINPIDVVTKVAMSDWGYTRYGTDMYIPSRETKSQYKELVLPVLNSYNAFTNKYHLYLPEVASQSYILDKALSGVATALGNDTTQRTMTLSYMLQQEMIESVTKTDEKLLEEVLKIFKIEIPKSFKLLSNQTIGQIVQGHYPEMCLAWMYNLDDYVFDTEDLVYRLVQVNCPVDVNVYSKEGTLVASIKDDTVIEIEGSYISAFVDENDQKMVCLPSDEEYDIEIIATDNGNMTYSVSEYNVGEACETKVVSYYDVEITEGDVLRGNVDIPAEEETDETDYTLTQETGEIIEPTIVKETEEINSYEVVVTSAGAGNVDGGGVFREGEFSKVHAIADTDAEFLGWYSEGELISIEEEYRFRVEKDTDLEAKFTYHDISKCAEVSNIIEKTYTGEAITQELIIKHKDYVLIENTDYTVTYSKNTEPGQATVEITGIGKYNGKVVRSFNIICTHSYGEEKVVIKATFKENGLKESVCNICNEAKPANIAKVKSPTISYTETVYNGKIRKPGITVTDTTGNPLTKGTDYDVTYASGRKNVGRYAVTVTLKGNYSGTKKVYFTIVPKKTSSLASIRYQYGNQIRLSWKKVTGATGYRVEYKKQGATKYTFLANTKNLYYTKGSLTANKTYSFKVTPYVTIGGTKYYSTSSTAYRTTSIATATKGKKLSQVSKPTVTKSGTKVKVKWKNVANETGYQISKSTSKTGTNIVSTYKTTSGTSKLITATKGTTYYYKVRAYRTVNGKKIYGAWSTTVKYKR